MTKRTTTKLTDNSQSEESYTYDAAGNIVGDESDKGFVYDTNNRLTSYDGNAVEYDMDGNMTSVVLEDEITDMEYDSANRLIGAGANRYAYNAEDVRIRNLCGGETTTYTYNTNCKLSQLLMKTTNGTVTKYVYGRGLIGEECGGTFKTYHFDNRGSTVAITDTSGKVTDAFRYDTYGKVTEHVGNSDVIFGYNGRDGVVTDKNGLIYMRARYYSPELRRFVNADVVAGKLSNAITLNRYAYANGNPVSNIDPFGLEATKWAYFESNLQENMPELYDLMKVLGIKFNQELSRDFKFDLCGMYLNLVVKISYETETSSDVTFDLSDSKATITHKITELPDGQGILKESKYFSWKDLSTGQVFSLEYGEYTFEVGKHDTWKTDKASISMVYTPEDPLLPQVTVEVEAEVDHLKAFGTVAAVAAVVYAAPVVIKAIAAGGEAALGAILGYLGTLIQPIQSLIPACQ